MRLKSLPLAIIPFVLCGCCTQNHEEPIPLARIEAQGIMGRLPRKLGTMMHIEGQVIASDPNKKTMEKSHILVSKIDGIGLPESIQMDFVNTEETPVKVGDRVQLIAHETGAYEGQVIDQPLMDAGVILLAATPNHHFHTRLVILCTEAEAVAVTEILRKLDGVGGMPPNHDAKDFDPELEKEAKSAATLIAKLEEFRRLNKTYPGTLKEVGHERSGWNYYRGKDGQSYSISIRLGWDPCLFYKRSRHQARWVFAPGDGSPDKEIKLSTPAPSRE